MLGRRPLQPHPARALGQRRQRGRRGMQSVAPQRDAPAREAGGGGAPDAVAHPQRPGALSALAEMGRRAEPELLRQRIVAGIDAGAEFGDEQHRGSSRGRGQLHPELSEAGRIEVGVDLHVLDELDGVVELHRRGGPGAVVGDRQRGGRPDRLGDHRRDVRPPLGQPGGRVGVHHPEPVVGVEVVAAVAGAVLECSRSPVAVAGVVLAGRGGQDQLDVAPGQVGVGGPDQRGHPGDYGRRRAGAAEAAPIVVVVRGGCNARPGVAVARRPAHPQVGARLRVRRSLVGRVHRADGDGGVVAETLIEVGVVAAEVVVAGPPHVDGSLAVGAGRRASFDGGLPQRGHCLRLRSVPDAPAVVADVDVDPVAGHGVGEARQVEGAGNSDVVELGPGRHAPPAQGVVPGRHHRGHRGAMIVIQVAGLGSRIADEGGRVADAVGVRAGRVGVVGEVFVVEVDATVDHGHPHSRAEVPGRVGRGHVGVPVAPGAQLADVVQVPLAAGEFVEEAGRLAQGPAPIEPRRILVVGVPHHVVAAQRPSRPGLDLDVVVSRSQFGVQVGAEGQAAFGARSGARQAGAQGVAVGVHQGGLHAGGVQDPQRDVLRLCQADPHVVGPGGRGVHPAPHLAEADRVCGRDRGAERLHGIDMQHVRALAVGPLGLHLHVEGRRVGVGAAHGRPDHALAPVQRRPVRQPAVVVGGELRAARVEQPAAGVVGQRFAGGADQQGGGLLEHQLEDVGVAEREMASHRHVGPYLRLAAHRRGGRFVGRGPHGVGPGAVVVGDGPGLHVEAGAVGETADYVPPGPDADVGELRPAGVALVGGVAADVANVVVQRLVRAHLRRRAQGHGYGAVAGHQRHRRRRVAGHGRRRGRPRPVACAGDGPELHVVAGAVGDAGHVAGQRPRCPEVVEKRPVGVGLVGGVGGDPSQVVGGDVRASGAGGGVPEHGQRAAGLADLADVRLSRQRLGLHAAHLGQSGQQRDGDRHRHQPPGSVSGRAERRSA